MANLKKHKDEDLVDLEKYKNIIFFDEYYNSPTCEKMLLDANRIENYAEEDGYSAYVSDNAADLLIEDLQKQLFAEVMKLKLTENQSIILKLTLERKTQKEIADQLGITQSAVHKGLSGNIDYNRGKKYGGIYRRLKKRSLKSERILDILSRIKKIRNSSIEDLEQEIELNEH